MSDIIKVFVSSTSDLKEERDALRQEVPSDTFSLYLYEYDYKPKYDYIRRKQKSPEDICLEEIKNSKIFVGLLGREYGSPFPPDKGTMSISEWEFKTAQDCSKDLGIDIKLFRKSIPDEKVEPRQLAFIQGITKFDATWCIKFDDKTRLVTDVLKSLASWAVVYYSETAKSSPEVASWLHRHLSIIAVASMAVSIILFAIFWRQLSNCWLAISCVFMLIQIGLCIVLLWSEIGGRNDADR